MKRGATGLAQRVWYGRSALSLALLPFSVLFGVIAAARRCAYRHGWRRSERLPVPVVIVGNLVAGGAGKTPLVLWLVAQLRARGWRPGILSRGYQGQNDTPSAVTPGADPATVGDEPALLIERAGVPVWIGRRRVEAGRALLAAHPECNVLICDDGLQHYALQRDVEIAVEDERGHGNGRLLPAGPLREPASRQVDATVVNGGRREGAYAMRLEAAGFYRVHDGAPVALESLQAMRLHAIAGIGNPDRFFRQLEAMALRFTAHPFPDHHGYREADLRYADCDAVLMTEKDAVKCRAFGRTDLVALRVEAVVDPALADLIETRLHGFAPA